MNKTIELLEYWYSNNRDEAYRTIQIEYTKVDYIKLQFYFNLYLGKVKSKSGFEVELTNSILKTNDFINAINTKNEIMLRWNKNMDLLWKLATPPISKMITNLNPLLVKIESLNRTYPKLKQDIRHLIESEIYDIKIQIISKKDEDKIVDKYTEAKILYDKAEYTEAISKAREVFKTDLFDNFNTIIKNIPETDVSNDINNILQGISNIRNHHKDKNIKNMPTYQLKAIAKLAIEQIINIRNFLSIWYDK